MEFNPEERVRRMVDAIQQEAKEKAAQIEESAEQAFKVEKNKIITEEEDKITQEFRLKFEEVAVKKRIDKSAKINQARLKKMDLRYNLIQKIKDDVKVQLQDVVNNQEKYKQIMKSLLVQSMIKLFEPNVTLICRKCDVQLVESIIGEAQQEFEAEVKKQINRDFKSTVTINKNKFLEDIEKDTIGGLQLTCYDGRIVCSNTLENRIQLAFQQSLPDIRSILFPDQGNKKN